MEIGPGREERAELQQPHGRRGALLELLEGQVPGGHHGHRVVRRLIQGQDPGGLRRQLLDVGMRRHAGLLQPRAGLLDRQGQVAEGLGDSFRVRRIQLGHVTQQMRDALVPGEHVHLEWLGGMGPGLIAGGDEHVTGPGGQVGLQFLRVLGVVEDQQPVRSGVAAQLLQGGLRRLRHVVADLEAHLAGQFRERLADLLGPLGRHPPDEVVVGHEPVRVLQRELGLADAAEPVQGLGDTTGPPPPASLSRSSSRVAPRPVKSAFLAGTFQIGGTVPGKRGSSACTAAPGRLGGPVQRPQQLRGRLGGVQPGQVNHGMVGERLGDPHVTDPDRHEMPLQCRRRRPPRWPSRPTGPRRVQVRGRQDRDGPGGGI